MRDEFIKAMLQGNMNLNASNPISHEEMADELGIPRRDMPSKHEVYTRYMAKSVFDIATELDRLTSDTQ